MGVEIIFKIAAIGILTAEMEEIVNDLTSKDAELQYNIQSRNQYIEKIRQRRGRHSCFDCGSCYCADYGY